MINTFKRKIQTMKVDLSYHFRHFQLLIIYDLAMSSNQVLTVKIMSFKNPKKKKTIHPSNAKFTLHFFSYSKLSKWSLTFAHICHFTQKFFLLLSP
ncbi:hypothetical protein HanIR_Chr15g0785901 [Helianthus annuus]|nr:hypothetical protein HanIR_Chr15g0785901 [Helianthus annuus]